MSNLKIQMTYYLILFNKKGRLISDRNNLVKCKRCNGQLRCIALKNVVDFLKRVQFIIFKYVFIFSIFKIDAHRFKIKVDFVNLTL